MKLSYCQFSWFQIAKLQIERLESEKQICCLCVRTVSNFKLPGSRPQKQTWYFDNWPYVIFRKSWNYHVMWLLQIIFLIRWLYLNERAANNNHLIGQLPNTSHHVIVVSLPISYSNLVYHDRYTRGILLVGHFTRETYFYIYIYIYMHTHVYIYIYIYSTQEPPQISAILRRTIANTCHNIHGCTNLPEAIPTRTLWGLLSAYWVLLRLTECYWVLLSSGRNRFG